MADPVAEFSEHHLEAMAEIPPSVFDTDDAELPALTPFDQVRPRTWSWMTPGAGS